MSRDAHLEVESGPQNGLHTHLCPACFEDNDCEYACSPPDPGVGYLPTICGPCLMRHVHHTDRGHFSPRKDIRQSAEPDQVTCPVCLEELASATRYALRDRSVVHYAKGPFVHCGAVATQGGPFLVSSRLEEVTCGWCVTGTPR